MGAARKRREDIRQTVHLLSDDVLIDDRQLGQIGGWSTSTSKRWRREGKLPEVVMINGLPRHRLGNIRALLQGKNTAAHLNEGRSAPTRETAQVISGSRRSPKK
jgi:hypothetical protein